jgi:hypothetical protein
VAYVDRLLVTLDESEQEAKALTPEPAAERKSE